MDSKPDKQGRVPAVKQLGAIAHPKNLLKTIASQIPFASAGVEMLNQLEGQRVDQRITALEFNKVDGQLVEKRLSSLEETDLKVIAEMQKLEKSVGPATPPPAVNEWPQAATEYLRRNVEFAVVHHPVDRPGREYILPVTNGCVVGDNYVLTCSEAMELVNDVAEHKSGRVIILFGLCWYEFQVEPADAHSGLVLCKLTKRDEQKFKRAREAYKKYDIDLADEAPTKTDPKSTITPWIGQEVGFILASDSENNWRQTEYSPLEFGTSVISHFRKPTDDAFKVLVTAVFSGRIKQIGSAVFSRDATLLGIISGVEKYEYDAGRRAVVKSLLGVPRFMDEYKRNHKR